MNTNLNELISSASNRAAAQANDNDKTQVFLFEENRSGNRMGKPGDANNIYYAEWFEFYSYSPGGNPQSEGGALNFKDPDTHKPVPGGNGVSEVDVIEKFRLANPCRSVVVLEIEPFKGNLEAKMYGVLQKYREDGKALLILPPVATPSKQAETVR